MRLIPYIFLLGALTSTFSSFASVEKLQNVDFSVDTIQHYKAGPGTSYTSLNMRSESKNLNVFVLEMEMKGYDNVDYRMEIGNDTTLSVEAISSVAKRKTNENTHYFAAVNADFYITSSYVPEYVGQPHMDCIMNGEIASTGYLAASDYGHFFMDYNKNMWCDNPTQIFTLTLPDGSLVSLPRINQDIYDNEIVLFNSKYGRQTRVSGCTDVGVRLADGESWGINRPIKLIVTAAPSTTGNTSITQNEVVISAKSSEQATKLASLKVGDEIMLNCNISLQDYKISPDIKECSGGDVVILKRGEVIYDAIRFINGRDSNNPRTMFGYNEDRSKMVWCVVDGRGVSTGCTYPEGADIMKLCGCYDAVNVDGGGSSGMYLQPFGIVNHPSDGKERAVSNGLYAVLEAPEDNNIAEIRFADWTVKSPKYGNYTPIIYGYNQYGLLVDTDVKGFMLSCTEELGEIINDGSTLFAKGDGIHLLSATFGDAKADVVVTIGGGTPSFRLDSVVVNSFYDYKMEVVSTVNGNQMPLDNIALKWSIDDSSIASIDDNGVIHGLKNGITQVYGSVDEITDTILVKVEIPNVRYHDAENNIDISTWKTSKSGVKNNTTTALGTNGLALDYTISSSRNPYIKISKVLPLWSRPDSIELQLNPGDASIKQITIQVTPSNGGKASNVNITPTLTANVVNRIALPISDFADDTDAGIYPLTINAITIYPGDAVNTVSHIEIPHIYGVHTTIAPDAGVENVLIENSTSSLFAYPNLAAKGEIIRLNIADNTPYNIYSISGALISTGIGNKIDSANLSKGIYFIFCNNSIAKIIIK
ncbi:MAG: phosphodiester glycosidase family protein [Muribaculaceae bacterium]|nr:phosphodiester glycosidase family protein [Muribaculaceae bacterium]